jgi:glycosyltransferase involved in cell wall biosynthesis
MRILFVPPFFPLPLRTGGNVRVFHVLKELARDHEVELVCPTPSDVWGLVPELTKLGVKVHPHLRRTGRRPLWRHLAFLPTPIPFSIVNYDRALAAKVRQVWKSGAFDVLQVEFLAMAYVAEDPCFEGARYITLHCPSAESYRRDLHIMPRSSPRHWQMRFELLKLGPYEKRVLRRFGGVFVTSERDQEILAGVAPDVRTVVVNNGVDADEFQPRPGLTEPDLVVSVCSFQTNASVDGVLFFLHEVWPLVLARNPSARYEIVGRAPPRSIYESAAGLKGVTVVGEVDDVRPYFARARLSVVMMRAGGGTKIRLFNSLAMGVPVVATPLGAEGVEGAPEGSVVIAETPSEIAGHVVAMLASGGGLRLDAREFVCRHHSWRTAALQMTRHYGGPSETVMADRIGEVPAQAVAAEG